MPIAIVADWAAIRDGYVLGLSSTELAERFGVSDSLIRVRAARGDWPSPRRVQAAREARAAQVAASGSVPSGAPSPCAVASPSQGPAALNPGRSGASLVADMPVVSRSVAKPSSGAEIVTEMAAEGLIQLGEAGNLAGARLLHGLLTRALSVGAQGLKPISDAGDVVTALKGLRVAAGLDKSDGVTVNLALFGSGAPSVDGFEV